MKAILSFSILWATLSVGCSFNPWVHSSVTNTCAGASVEIEWFGDGAQNLVLEVIPHDGSAPSSTPVSDRGKKTITVQRSAKICMIGTYDGRREPRCLDVNVVPRTGKPADLTLRPRCDKNLSPANFEWSTSVSPNEYAPVVTVGTVTNLSDRALTVSHQGQPPKLLRPHESSQHWSGVPYVGDWIATGRLKDFNSGVQSVEDCGAPQGSVNVPTTGGSVYPESVNLGVQIFCAGP